MKKFLQSLVGLCLVLGISALTMIHGWGLVPVSWGWIIGGGLSTFFVAGLFL